MLVFKKCINCLNNLVSILNFNLGELQGLGNDPERHYHTAITLNTCRHNFPTLNENTRHESGKVERNAQSRSVKPRSVHKKMQIAV
jgi:hypothetical protein